jgi:hypothetical protein
MPGCPDVPAIMPAPVPATSAGLVGAMTAPQSVAAVFMEDIPVED